MKRILFFICMLVPFSIFSEGIISSGRSRYFIHSIGGDSVNNNKAMEILGLDTNSSPFTGIEKIGWSQKGLFAYRYRRYLDSGRGTGWVYSLKIINAVSDKIIEEDAIELYDDELEEMSGDLSVDYKTKWNTILEKHNIVERVDNPISEKFKTDLLEFPVNNYNCWFDYQVKRVTKFSETYGENKTYNNVNCKLIIGNNTIQKIISENSGDYGGNDFANIFGKQILGYYKSPYENRIVVVTANYSWVSFSGGYNSVDLDLFGCNLNVGLSR